ncbi:MAG: tripartite tricarboxylate transporter TctB family protein [Paracoccaceae bacterium]
MALDRWIALTFVALCCVYGWTAFTQMDGALPPFMQRNPVWPSTFPKILSVAGALVGLVVLLGVERREGKAEPDPSDMVLARLTEYKLGQGAALLGLMVLYALLLRPGGFLLSTFGFLFLGSALLGERRWILMALVSALAAGVVWYLVQEVLGIFLRPLPFFLR